MAIEVMVNINWYQWLCRPTFENRRNISRSSANRVAELNRLNVPEEGHHPCTDGRFRTANTLNSSEMEN